MSLWSEDTIRFLNTLLDRRGVRLQVLRSLSSRNMRLGELSDELADYWDHTPESLIRHVRILEGNHLVIRDSGKYLCVCPAKTRDFLISLDSLLNELSSTTQGLFLTHKKADASFKKYIIAKEQDQKQMKPVL